MFVGKYIDLGIFLTLFLQSYKAVYMSEIISNLHKVAHVHDTYSMKKGHEMRLKTILYAPECEFNKVCHSSKHY